MERLDDAAISAGLERLEWQRAGDAIVKVTTFRDFAEAWRFATAVAEAAERRQHHPDIAVSWNRVTLTLSTHSAGGLTDRDLGLAGVIDAISEAGR
jgi:4a-hydroxytetrahydrobiopterin dehydratase